MRRGKGSALAVASSQRRAPNTGASMGTSSREPSQTTFSFSAYSLMPAGDNLASSWARPRRRGLPQVAAGADPADPQEAQGGEGEVLEQADHQHARVGEL